LTCIVSKNGDVKQKLGPSHTTFPFEKKEPNKKGNQGSYPFLS
jgi:hypothetical protein